MTEAEKRIIVFFTNKSGCGQSSDVLRLFNWKFEISAEGDIWQSIHFSSINVSVDPKADGMQNYRADSDELLKKVNY